MAKELHVFTDGTYWYVGRDISHVLDLYEHHNGHSYSDECMLDGQDASDYWGVLPDDNMLNIQYEQRDDADLPSRSRLIEEHPYWSVTATCRDWADVNGAGMLCSTEW